MDFKIEPLRMVAMSNELHYQFHEDLTVSLDKILSRLDAGMKVLVGAYKKAGDDEKTALDVVTDSKYTPLIAEKDTERREIYSGFVLAVKSMTCVSDDVEKYRAAGRVMKIFSHYKNIPRRSYSEETAAINDMVREFERADLAADLETLKVTDWLTRLAAKNEEFVLLMYQRDAERATQPSVRMKEARVETDRLYRNIVTHLEDLNNTGMMTDEHLKLVADLNVLIIRYRNYLNQKAGRKNSKETGEQEPEPEHKPDDKQEHKPKSDTEPASDAKPETEKEENKEAGQDDKTGS